MGFSIEAGRIVATNALGQTVLDTDEGQFVVTDYVSGSITLPGYTATNRNFVDSPVYVDTESVLGSINAASDTVRGGFFVSNTGLGGNLNNIGWFNAGGTYVHFAQGSSGPFTPGNVTVGSLALYTFVAAAGQLKIKQQIKLRANWSSGLFTNSTIMTAPTFQYKLFCGAFI